MSDTSPYVRELKKQHAAELAKQEARIAELEEDRDNLRRWYNRAIDTVDRVFQVESGKPPPILPDFLRLGDDKFAGVVQLANEYKQLRADLTTHMHLVRTMGERCGLLGRLLEKSCDVLRRERWLGLVQEIERALAQGEGSE